VILEDDYEELVDRFRQQGRREYCNKDSSSVQTQRSLVCLTVYGGIKLSIEHGRENDPIQDEVYDLWLKATAFSIPTCQVQEEIVMIYSVTHVVPAVQGVNFGAKWSTILLVALCAMKIRVRFDLIVVATMCHCWVHIFLQGRI
jgi:hypothetical protein